MYAEAVWYARLSSQSKPTFMPDDLPRRDQIRHKWDQIQNDWHTYLTTLTDQELNQIHHIIPSTGTTYHVTTGEVIFHVINHSTNHRAQILRLLHDYDASTFEQDISRYYRDRT